MTKLKTFCLSLLFPLAACGLETSSAAPRGPVSVPASPVQRCMNLGGALEASNEGDWGYTVSFFYNQADDYIYQSATGLLAADGHDEHEEHEGEAHDDDHDVHAGEMEEAHEEGLEVFSFRQADADIYGMEAQVYVDLNTEWRVEVFGDMIRAKLDNQDLPRIPPLRVGSTLSYEHQGLRADLGFTFNDEQEYVAPYETTTDSYTMVNAGVEYEMPGAGADWVIFASADNLLDEEARVHTSFLKNQAPLPGRNFTVGVRALF